MSGRRSGVIPLLAISMSATVLLGGCASLMARSTIAPEWFQAKAIEVKGEGYPTLAEVPAVRLQSVDTAQWEADSVRLRAEADAIESQAGAEGAAPTEDDIRASAAQLRALLDTGVSPEAATSEVAPKAP